MTWLDTEMPGFRRSLGDPVTEQRRRLQGIDEFGLSLPRRRARRDPRRDEAW